MLMHVLTFILFTTVDLCKNCQHFCYNDSKCGCNIGYTLSSDKHSCIKCADVSATYLHEGRLAARATWHVTICINDKAISPVCSGNLINDQWVITSAKCVCSVNTTKDSLSLRLWKSHTCAVDHKLNLPVSDIYCHPDHKSFSAKFVDLALIKAESRIPVNDTFPLCLDNYGDSISDIYRYGIPNNFATFGIEVSDSAEITKENSVLGFARVFLLPSLSCTQQFSAENVLFSRNPIIFCTNYNRDSNCPANTGSAIVLNGPHGSMIFAGIASSFSGECGIQRSFIAAIKVQDEKVLNWMRSIIAEVP